MIPIDYYLFKTTDWVLDKVGSRLDRFHGWVTRRHTPDKIKNSEVIVILTACYDHNYATRTDAPFLFFRQFWSQKKFVMIDVNDVGGIVKGMEQVYANGNKVHGVWFNCHGCEDGMQLGKNSGLTHCRQYRNIDALKSVFSRMEKEASIVLESCSTGRVVDHVCIAQAIADVAVGHTVYAPIKDVATADCQLNFPDKGFEARFWCPKHASGLIENIFNHFLFIISIGWYSDDNTAKFRSVKELKR